MIGILLKISAVLSGKIIAGKWARTSAPKKRSKIFKEKENWLKNNKNSSKIKEKGSACRRLKSLREKLDIAEGPSTRKEPGTAGA